MLNEIISATLQLLAVVLGSATVGGLGVVAFLLLRVQTPFPRDKITLPDGRLLEGPYRALGKGSFGSVRQYRLNDAPIAVKIPSDANNNSIQQHELTILKKVNPHPSVIKLIESVYVDGRLWILMDLMQGSVRDLLVQKPNLTSNTKLSIALQLAKGITYLHNLNSDYIERVSIVHNDLKTTNLLLDKLEDSPNITVKICDFGSARQMDHITLPILGLISAKVYKGYIGCTMNYAAPEVIASFSTGKPSFELGSDVFSAGMILWELATNNVPDRSPKEIVEGTFDEFIKDQNTARAPRTFLGLKSSTWTQPTYPKSSFFGPIIDRAIKPKSEDRISAVDMLKDLQKISLK